MTKYVHRIVGPMEKMLYLATHGRKGPVGLDVPVDVQGAMIETDELKGFDPNELKQSVEVVYDTKLTPKIIEKLQNTKRPVLYSSNGIRLGGAHDEFIELIDKWQISVVMPWNGQDLLWDEHPCYCGNPGSMALRGGNFVVQNSDVLFVLNCQLNIVHISNTCESFAENAYKIIVHIDDAELKKHTVKADLPVHADVKDIINDLFKADYHKSEDQKRWLVWSKNIHEKYPATLSEYYQTKSPVNPYAFFKALYKDFQEGEHIICGNGTACVSNSQVTFIKKGQRHFTNSEFSPMGYGLSAAMDDSVSRTILIDGSFQRIYRNYRLSFIINMDIKMFYLNDNGYQQLRQTQTNFFKPPLVGVGDGNGLSFPNMKKLLRPMVLPMLRLTTLMM